MYDAPFAFFAFLGTVLAFRTVEGCGPVPTYSVLAVALAVFPK